MTVAEIIERGTEIEIAQLRAQNVALRQLLRLTVDDVEEIIKSGLEDDQLTCQLVIDSVRRLRNSPLIESN